MSKQITSMTRLTGQIEKMFREVNHDFFNGELPTPIISVIPTAKAFAHCSIIPIWECKDDHKYEINISSSYLRRPLENTVASLIHECCHLYACAVLNVSDTSRGGTYHSKVFKGIAESHALICTKTDKYGWADTSSVLSDTLLEWVMLHDEFREIEMCRNDPAAYFVGIGAKASEQGTPTAAGRQNHNHRYICPCCRSIARSGKVLHLICGDCKQTMVEA